MKNAEKLTLGHLKRNFLKHKSKTYKRWCGVCVTKCLHRYGATPTSVAPQPVPAHIFQDLQKDCQWGLHLFSLVVGNRRRYIKAQQFRTLKVKRSMGGLWKGKQPTNFLIGRSLLSLHNSGTTIRNFTKITNNSTTFRNFGAKHIS